MSEDTDSRAGNEGAGNPAAAPKAGTGEAKTSAPRAEETAPKPDAGAAEGAAEGVVEVKRIKYDDFMKVELRTAKIKLAEKVEGADRLLRLELEVGDEERQIVAGIAEHYAPEDLAGRMIVMVFNLKPAKIRGVKSNGMLLAASTDDTLKLVTIDGDFPTGVRVR